MSKSKKIKMTIGVVIISIVMVGIGSFISYSKFRVLNPFTSTSGLIQVIFTEKDYVEIQQYPKVILAKPNASLENYMKEKGFKEDTENRMGALRVFTNDVSKQYVFYSTNQYFSKWRWRE